MSEGQIAWYETDCYDDVLSVSCTDADMTYNTNYRRCVHYIRPDPETEDDEPDCSDAGDSDEGEGVQDAL